MILIPLVLTVEPMLGVVVVMFAVELLKLIVFVDITVVFRSVKFCSGPYKGTT